MGKKRRRKKATPSTDREPSAGSSRRGDLGLAAGLTVLAWLHRLAFLHSNQDRGWPFTVFYQGDSRTFFEYARALLAGRLYDSGIPFHPPGFPAFLAGVHTLLGAGPDAGEIPHLAVKSILALVSSLSVGLVYLLARPYLGRVAALFAALLCLYHFGLYAIAVAPVSEGLYLTLLLGVLLLWSRKLPHPLAAPGSEAPRKTWAVGLALGFGLGILALVRAESVLIAGLLVAAGLSGLISGAQRLERTKALLPWVLVGAGWILAVAPWTIRNAVRLSQYSAAHAGSLAEPLPRIVPLTIYGPLNLALANRPGGDGAFSPDPITGGRGGGGLDFTDPVHLRYVLHGDELAWQWIRSHPADFAALAGRKWALSLDVFKLGWTQWNWPGGLDGVRRPVDVFVPDDSPGKAVVPMFVLLGWLACLATPGGPRRWGVLVALLSGAWLVVTGLFFGYVRQALLVLPFWLSLAVAGPAWLWGRLKHEAPFPDALPPCLIKVLAVLVAIFLVLEGRGSRADRNFQATGDTVDGRILNPDSAIRLKVLPPVSK